MKNITLTTILIAGLTAGCASYGGSNGGSSNAVLTTAAGMTLYTFDEDSGSESNCYDTCAVKWPPYLVSDGEAPSAAASKSTRRDGSEQWTVNSQPLYTWVGDTKPGDTTGDGVGGVWHTATIAATVKAKGSSSY